MLILSDEIYSRICYEEEPQSITQFDGMLEKTIILDGFSKTYSMTGWRLGYGVMPLWLADAVDKLMVNSNSCTASFTQRAGLAALQGPQDARRRDGRRVPPPARCHREGPERDSRLPLHGAGRRVLRVPERDRTPACRAASSPTCCSTRPASRA